MTGERHLLLQRREILAAYLNVLDRGCELLALCSSVEGDAEQLRDAVQDAFALSPTAAEAVLAPQGRRFTPSERSKIQHELFDLDLRLEQIGA